MISFNQYFNKAVHEMLAITNKSYIITKNVPQLANTVFGNKPESVSHKYLIFCILYKSKKINNSLLAYGFVKMTVLQVFY